MKKSAKAVGMLAIAAAMGGGGVSSISAAERIAYAVAGRSRLADGLAVSLAR